MMTIYTTKIETPIGQMIACATDKGICLLEFHDRKNLDNQISSMKRLTTDIVNTTNLHLDLLKNEIEEYFTKKRTKFSIPIDLIGTEFQKQVWTELLRIPYGEKVTYLEQATSMGNPKSTRAVANANSRNKIAIIIPCHRVIGSSGKLTGYAGGLERKEWLLNFESNNSTLFSRLTK